MMFDFQKEHVVNDFIAKALTTTERAVALYIALHIRYHLSFLQCMLNL